MTKRTKRQTVERIAFSADGRAYLVSSWTEIGREHALAMIASGKAIEVSATTTR